jgi:hypothetical protein
MGGTLIPIDGTGCFDEPRIAHAGLAVSAVDSTQGCRLGLTHVPLSGANRKHFSYLRTNHKSATFWKSRFGQQTLRVPEAEPPDPVGAK